jgi:hypothetical protein
MAPPKKGATHGVANTAAKIPFRNAPAYPSRAAKCPAAFIHAKQIQRHQGNHNSNDHPELRIAKGRSPIRHPSGALNKNCHRRQNRKGRQNAQTIDQPHPAQTFWGLA